MKKPSSRIREEIARLQEQLKTAETREAERIGRIALKAGLGEVEIDEAKLLEGFEELAKRFQGSSANKRKASPAPEQAGAASRPDQEA
ncbi:MAG: TraC family protein [Rhodobiaceae bacterium]|nr:TraC family protein [Rhodobiaceae bacterium]